MSRVPFVDEHALVCPTSNQLSDEVRLGSREPGASYGHGDHEVSRSVRERRGAVLAPSPVREDYEVHVERMEGFPDNGEDCALG